MINIDDAIKTLEYLISGECTEPAIEFYDEISFAIKMLKTCRNK